MYHIRHMIRIWICDRHNAIRQRRQPHRGYYDSYHGYWLPTLSMRQNNDKCKTEKRAIANRKNTDMR